MIGTKLITIFAIFATYLILTLPVAYAQSVSSVMQDEKEPQEVVGNILLMVPAILSEAISMLQMVVENFMNSVIPSANAQSVCDGDGICEANEYTGDCCFDCGCSTNYQYCDWDGTSGKTDLDCKTYSSIDLILAGLSSYSFDNCNIPHNVNITFTINYPPSSMVFSGKNLFLGGKKIPIGNCEYLSSESIPQQKKYRCPVTIPALDDCSTGTTNLVGNSLQLNLSFNDGGDPTNWNLNEDIPDVSIGSYVCGNGIPESDLGETCCYDIGCPLTDWFCDIADLDIANDNYAAGSCKPELVNNDISVTNPSKTVFETHDSLNNGLTFDVEIYDLNGLKYIETPSCNPTCSSSGGCQASCSVVCDPLLVVDDVYTGQCSMIFSITSYDQSNSYLMRPAFTFPVTYNDGPGTNTVELTPATPFTISISSSVCGDGVDGPDEDQSNCCLDVPCSTGYYCDWHEGSGQCKPDNIGVYLDGVSPSELSTQTKKGPTEYQGGFPVIPNLTSSVTTDVVIRVENMPDGFIYNNLATTCNLGDGISSCKLTKKSTSDTQTGQLFVYELTIPDIRYEDSVYYSSSDKQLVLDEGTIHVSFAFVDGKNVIERSVDLVLPDITINIVPGCGNGVDESHLGETCCFDIGCAEGQECIGSYENNMCVDPAGINMVIYNVPAQNCVINKLGDGCVMGQFDFYVDVHMQNTDDLKLIRSYYTLDDGSQRPLECPASEFDVDRERFTCTLAEIVDKDNEAPSIHHLNVTFVLDFGGGETITRTDSFGFTVRGTKTDDIKACEEKLDYYNTHEVEFHKQKQTWVELKKYFEILAIALGGACAACSFLVAIGIGGWCAPALPYLCYGAVVAGFLACIFGILAGDEGVYQDELNNWVSQKAEFETICNPVGVHLTPKTIRDMLDDLDEKYDKAHQITDPMNWKKELALCILMAILELLLLKYSPNIVPSGGETVSSAGTGLEPGFQAGGDAVTPRGFIPD